MTDFERLPNFFIIGAAKCGTTALHEMLIQHPQVYMPARKEPNFFGRDEVYARGIHWYTETHFRQAAGYPARGEASVYYLSHSTAAAPRMKAAYGERPLRLIAIFRDPVKRAYSDYWHWVRNQIENLPFEQAIAAEDAWFDSHPGMLPPPQQRRHFWVGRYASHLRPFLNEFPRESFLFLLQEDLQRDYKDVIRQVFSFLEIDPDFQVQLLTSNSASMPRSRWVQEMLLRPTGLPRLGTKALERLLPAGLFYRMRKRAMEANLKPYRYPPMNSETARWLRERYRGEIEELEGLIGRDLSAWMDEGKS